jgi:hypothetical protein
MIDYAVAVQEDRPSLPSVHHLYRLELVMTRYTPFNRAQVSLRPIAERGHDLLVTDILPLTIPDAPFCHPQFGELVDAVRIARRNQRPVILMLGGHPIKLGLSRLLIDLMKHGWVTHVAMNGAGIIHDFELASVGGTSENVAKWITEGQFGLWSETSLLNEIIAVSARNHEGLGEGVGRETLERQLPHAEISVAAAGYRLGIPVTCHVTIGGDIIHAMPNADGAALGRTSDLDFLIFTNSVLGLAEGVFLNIGSAVTGPEVFLKALSMARNLAHQGGERIENFTTAVFDLVGLPDDYRAGPPGNDHPLYYYRPWKTLLCRTVSSGGRSFYFQGDHRVTLPSLWHCLMDCR